VWRALLLVTVTILSLDCCAGTESKRRVAKADTKSEHGTAVLCSVPKGYAVGSVAWSPNGSRIAFVAARWRDDTDGGLSSNSVWVQSVPTIGSRPVRLVALKRKGHGEGIATVLFWLNNDRVGWATQDGLSYSFMQMGLREREPKRLVSRSFGGTPCSDSIGGSAPNDVCYDANSRALVFSGSLAPAGVYVRVLRIRGGTVRSLSVPYPKGWSRSEGYLDAATACGSLANPARPVFYVAVWMTGYESERGGCYLWRSNSYSLKEDKAIVSFAHKSIAWPRVSPDGKRLAYAENGQLVMHELESGKRTTLAKRAASGSPAGGWCPYSWSPDGRRIAYADGSTIRIVRVVPVAAPRKKSTR